MERPLEDLAQHVIDLVGDRAEAQVRVVDLRHGLTRFANSHIHQHVGEQTVEVVLKIASDGRVASASTTRTTDDDLRSFVDATLDVAAVAPVDEDWPGMAPATPLENTDTTSAATVDATPEARTEIVKAFVEAGDGLNAAGYCETEHLRLAFANTAGQQASAQSTRATIDGIHRTATSAGQGHQTSRSLADLDGGAAGRQAADLARRGQDPVDPDPDRYEVVLGPEAVATIFQFLSFYGFNAKAMAEGRSFVQLGEHQFDEAITLVDDVNDPRSVGLTIDVEGTPTQALRLIDAGVSTALAYDRRTASAENRDSTGHAIPGSEQYGPVAANLLVGAADRSPADLVAGMERGLLVTAFNYCRVLDPMTMVITGLTRNGTFLVEDGKVVRPVGNLRFTQSFVAGLAPGQVLGVGNDGRHAEGEFGPGMVWAPSLRLASWNISGTARG
jgi:predicted Zn-dependent protease